MNTHAALGDELMVISNPSPQGYKLERVALLPGIHSPNSLLDIADQHHIKRIWIVPGSQYSQLDPEWAKSDRWDLKVSLARAERGKDVIRQVVARRNNQFVTITCPEWTAYDWRVEEVGPVDAVAVLAAIDYLQKALGVEQLDANPGVQGRKLIKEMVSLAWLKTPRTDLTKIPVGIGVDLAYRRIITDAGDYKYIVGTDKNSSYLGSCTGAMLGCDEPVYFPSGEIYKPDTKLPGIWKVSIKGELPALHPLYSNLRGKLQEWVTHPILNWLYKNGIEVDVHEGWQWKESHRVLEKWATRLFGAKQELSTYKTAYRHDAGRELAYYSVKRIATAGVGILGSPDAYKFCPQFYRPDWRAIVPELAKVRFVEQLQGIYRDHGVLPVLAAVDEVYYLSKTPDIRQEIPGKFDKVGLGGWKDTLCLEITPAILALLKDDRYSAGTLKKALKQESEKLT
jgi:hypothetical protein